MKTPNHIDRHVGARLRELREARGLDLQTLARQLGVSEPSLMVLEEGRERISAELMLKLSRILRARPAEFFAGLAGRPMEAGNESGSALTEPDQEKRLLADFARIRDAKSRNIIVALVAAYAEFGDLNGR